MKKVHFTIILLGLFFLAVHLLSFTNTATEEALTKVKTQFHTGLDDLEIHIDELVEHALDVRLDSSQLEALQKAHLATRNSFKKIEYLLEYNDPSSIKRWLNGAPLPTLEKKVADIRILKPEGLQILDELIFGESAIEEIEEIVARCKTMQSSYKNIKKYQAQINTTHRHIFEAVRRQLIRIFTLGVTGFDTPGSVNGIPEAITSLQSISDAMDAYYPIIRQEDEVLVSEMGGLFREAISYMASNLDFDSFDRLFFLKQYINPLYRLTFEAHQKTGIEMPHEVEEINLPKPINYDVVNLFDRNFLNINYFSNLDFENPHIEKRIELGKTLFFDPVLSSNIKMSCASCHQPEKGFSDGLEKSLASTGKKSVARNSPTVINAAFAERYFYDMRQDQLSRQIKHVILDTLEFATSFTDILNKLKKSTEYNNMFAEAYSDYPQYALSAHSVSDALATYVASLHFFNSPVDQYIRNEIPDLDPAVKRGFNLFMGKAACGTCHFAPNFSGMVPPLYTDTESEILGIPSTPDTLHPMLDTDLGRIGNKRPADQAPFYKHAFKTVTVRNIALTAPYMHNGVYQTLEEVVDFYNRGGGAGMGMEVPYQTLPDVPLNLTKQEQEDLVAFMEALTDKIDEEIVPKKLPSFEDEPEWNKRELGSH